MNEVPDDKGRFLGDRLEEFLKAMELENNPTDHNTNAKNHERPIRWALPPKRRALLNTDKASKGNSGVAVGGGVIRGDRGEWIQGSNENFGICTSVKMELKVVLRGLHMVREIGLRGIWLQSDSMIIGGML